MSVFGDLKELIKLVDSVRELKDNTKELADIANDIDKRLTILEERQDLIIEKAKSAAANAATVASQRMSESTIERILRLENELGSAQIGNSDNSD